MKTGAAGPAGSADSDAERLSRRFVTIVVIEILSIAALYWLGAHFAGS